MINEITIKEFRLEKEYAQALDLFNGNIDKVEMYISTDKRVNKIIPVNRGGYSFDVKSNDLLELEAKEKGLDVMVFDENAENLFNLIVLAKPSDLYDFNDNDVEITTGLNEITEFTKVGSITKVFDFDYDEKLKEI